MRPPILAHPSGIINFPSRSRQSPKRMRNAFAQEITDLAGKDERIVLIMADIGNRLFNDYRDRYPDRFFNSGVAEANTISMAAGMASEGLRPVCYTITPFITARCLEQIRIDVCYHQMPVTIVGTGSGLSYASLGVTHHSCEDIATLRALPEMAVMAPADSMEVRSCLRTALSQKTSPVYIRIGKKNESVIHKEPPVLRLSQAVRIRKGTGICILSTGNLLPSALEAADRLGRERGVNASVYSCPSVKPLPEDLLGQALRDYDVVVTIEEHSEIGGFGSAVAEWIADQEAWPSAKLVRVCTEDRFLHETTNQPTARKRLGVDVDRIVSKTVGALG